MQIPLHQFEQHIDEAILKRGMAYFKNRQVHPPEEITSGQYEAIVEGSEDYTVRMNIQNRVVREYSCTCPYDLGPVCKHVVAVLFYLQQDELGLEAFSKKKKADTKPAKRKTVADRVDDLLEKIPHDELKQFVRNNVADNSSFRNLFLSSYAHLTEGESLSFYRKQVKSILQTAKGRGGFIEWSQARYVGKQAHDLLNTAYKHEENQNYRSAIFICCAVLDEMTGALQYADDSNGDIGGPLNDASGLLSEISQKQLPEDIRFELFCYCISAFEKNIFSGWDWHLGMLSIASQVARTDEEMQKLLALIDQPRDSEYERQESQQIKFYLLQKFKGQEEAARFMEQHLSNPSLRAAAIQKAIDKKDFDKAIAIAQDGIKHDEKSKPGLVADWHDWLLRIAMQQGDKEKIILYARKLFVDSNRDKREYYQLMKTQVAPEQWTAFVEDLVRDIRKKSRWLDFGVLADIFISEAWWDRLLKLLRENPSLNHLEHYEKYLAKDYAKELAQMYAHGISESLSRQTGRNHYQTACRYLRRIIKLGEREIAQQMMDGFRTQYAQRKALMEELDRV